MTVMEAMEVMGV
jgi:hypothetical protein